MMNEIKKLYGKNFIGYDDLIQTRLKLNCSNVDINIDMEILKKFKDNHILILGSKNSIMDLRNIFGLEGDPCFYNQDWYLKENFVTEPLENKWYLVQKDLIERGKTSKEVKLPLPSAILTTYTFFMYYLINKEILWKHDYIWNSDLDSNGDQIYTGRYCDAKGINRNGFSIHRYLTVTKNYGFINYI